MVITDITKQNSRQDRFNIFIDGNFACGLSSNYILELKIAKGDEITPEELLKLKHLGLKSLCIENALDYLSYRPRSIKEVKTYLNQKIYKYFQKTNPHASIRDSEKEKIIIEVLDYLKAKDYLSDQKFAQLFISQRLSSSNPKSINYIKSELIQKGIDRTLANEILNVAGQDGQGDIANAQKAADYKIRRLPDNSPKSRQKLARYLLSKGYTWDTISDIIDSFSS